ncbi:multiple epidermal growth factor-like domains protein 11 [Gigantopelta aegis]|uniref:multiple epidermal growth factor-like domains protein 11 n=1 Tax=Gigantopelta aegis TaxID=1735272 RepID=UPI001B88BD0F|nr:multiple epidermal growth factor-like domains protein 11 [Gigantopelta aegis]
MAPDWTYVILLVWILMFTSKLTFTQAACELGVNYGTQCKKLCTDRHCSDRTSSCGIYGSCNGGCLAGWRGHDCTKECWTNFYGQTCRKYCSGRHCASPSAGCNAKTGDCGAEGCLPGWKGVDCTQESVVRTFLHKSVELDQTIAESMSFINVHRLCQPKCSPPVTTGPPSQSPPPAIIAPELQGSSAELDKEYIGDTSSNQDGSAS